MGIHLMAKLHIRDKHVPYNTLCGSIVDYPKFIDDNDRFNRNAIGQAKVCARCRNAILKIIDDK